MRTSGQETGINTIAKYYEQDSAKRTGPTTTIKPKTYAIGLSTN
jgi:hypothetical protein